MFLVFLWIIMIINRYSTAIMHGYIGGHLFMCLPAVAAGQRSCRGQVKVFFQVLWGGACSLIALRERHRLRIVLSPCTEWRFTLTKKMRAFKTKFRQLNARSLTLKLSYCLDSTALTLSFLLVTHRSQTCLLKQTRWSWVWFSTICFNNRGINR